MTKPQKILLSLCLTLCCCGCMPATQLEDRAIVQAAAVDYADGQFRLTLQIFEADSGSEKGGSSYRLVQGSGTGLTQAFEEIAQSGKEIYLGSCQVLLVGKDSGIKLKSILEFFNSRPQTRATMMTACTDTKSADLLNLADQKATPSPAESIEQILEQAEKEKRLLPCRLKDILSAFETDGWDGTLPLLAAEGEEPDARPVLKGSIVFREELPAVELSLQETALLGQSLGGQGNNLLNVANEKNSISASLLLEDFSPMLSSHLQNGVPVLCFELKVKGRVSESEVSVSEISQQQLLLLQNAAAEEMTRQMQALLKKLSEAGCDPLRFGERLQRSHPREWREVKESWPILLGQANWKINISCELSAFS